jgi:hypothetical protein
MAQKNFLALGFIEKNRDTLFQDFKRLLWNSKNATLRSMWPEGSEHITKVYQTVCIPDFNTVTEHITKVGFYTRLQYCNRAHHQGWALYQTSIL